jgi:hypothetical protein
MKSRLYRKGLLFLAVLLSAAVNPVFAQQHVVKIENGNVSIDGRIVPASELPASLKMKNMRATLSFEGDELLDLNGTIYAFLDGRMIEADPDDVSDAHVMAFFTDPYDDGAFVRMLTRKKGVHEGPVPSGGNYRVTLKDYYGVLSDKARKLDDLRIRIESVNDAPNVELARELKIEAENTARIAGALPRIEFETYLEDLQQNNYPLYGQLIQEQDLERRTRRLALRAKSALSEANREKVIDELRSQLDEIFALKQRNREREIEQLEARLTELKERLSKRSGLKKRIIENRIRELLGESNW